MSFAPKQFIRSVDFLSTENAINTSTGCVNIYGGMSVSKDSYLTNMTVVGNSTINNLNITGALITSTGNSLVSSQWMNVGSNGIYFGTSSNTLVGIGTTTPGFTLDISGGSRITGGLTVGNLNVNTGSTITNILNTTICTGTLISNTITTSNIYVTNGNVTVPNGQFLANPGDTVSAPGFSWSGDTNVGMYRPSGDAIGLVTFGVERMRITSTGNIGINTTSPGSRLEVNGTMKTGDITVGNINFTGSLYQNGSAYLGSQWTTTSGNTLTYTSGSVNINSGFSSTFNSNTLGNIFTTGGNVGIGTSSPSYKLDVNGDLRATGRVSSNDFSRNFDNRTLAPNSIAAGTFSVGFGSYANNNFGNWADVIALNTYTDASGENQNAIFIRKNGIGMRIYQGAFGSASAFSDYRDVVLSNSSGNVEIINLNSTNISTSSITTSSATISQLVATNVSSGSFVGSSATLNGALNASGNSNTIGNLFTTGGNVGIGTSSPTNKFSLYGDASSTNGPHTWITTSQDSYPVFQQLNWEHDNISLNFDGYYNGQWRSSSNSTFFQILKASNLLTFTYANGSAGSSVTSSRANAMVINSSGNIGIGTSSPSYLLDVNGNARISKTYLYTHSSTNMMIMNSSMIGNEVSGFALFQGSSGDTVLNTASTQSLQFKIGNVEYMRITGGNVGIGTNSPNAALQLGNVVTNRRIVLWETTNNDHEFYGFGINTRTLRYQVDNTISAHRFFAATGPTSSNELMSILGNGNVGIGTSSPGGKLDIVGTNRTSHFAFQTDEHTYIRGGKTNSNVLINDNGGNVGIGTSSPDNALHVNGYIRFYDSSQTPGLNNTGDKYPSKLYFGNGFMPVIRCFYPNNSFTDGTDLQFLNGGNNTAAENLTPRIVIKGHSGYVGINTTSPNYTLDVNGIFNTSSAIVNGTLNASGNSNTIGNLFTTGGNVGIRTTSPNTFLVVGPNGGVNGTGDIPGISMKSVSGSTMSYSVGQSDTNNIFLAWYHNATPTNGYASLSTYSGSNNLILQRDGGNVGIGTTQASSKLVVTDSGATKGHLKLVSSTNAAEDNWWLGFCHSDSNDSNDRARIGVKIQSGGPGRLFFTTGAAGSQGERMTIDASGNVGIGTTAPANALDIVTNGDSSLGFGLTNNNTGANSRINWNMYVGFSTSGNAGQIYASTSDPTFTIRSYTANTSGISLLTGGAAPIKFVTQNTIERMRIATSGNVGIGVSNITSKLHIYDTTNGISGLALEGQYEASSILPFIRFGPSSIAGATGGYAYISTEQTGIGANGQGGILRLFTKTANALTYSGLAVNQGSIGIGTTSPLYTLDVNGTFETSNSNGLMLFASNGNLGIGTTSPSGKLTVLGGGSSGTIRIYPTSYAGETALAFYEGQSSGNNWVIGNNSWNTGQLVIGSSSANGPVTTFTTAGNVGIGTTSPSEKLHVNGNILLGPSTADSNTDYSINSPGQLTIHSNNASTQDNTFVALTLRAGISSNQSNIVISGSGDNLYRHIAFSTMNTERMRLSSAGNLGIGTTTPVTKLHVEDGSAFIGDVGSGFSTSVPSTTSSVTTANGYRLFFDNSFNGTAGAGIPANKIVLHNNNWTGGFGMESSAVTYHSGNLHRFYCDANNTSTYGSLALSVGSTNTIAWTNTNGEGALKIQNSNAGTSAYSTIRVGNNIGDAVMFLNSNARTADGGTNAFTIRNDIGALRLQGGGATNTIFLPGSSTNVGINTTAPSYALHVAGDIYATGDVISFSDSRLKTDVQTINNALDKVNSMRGVYYTNLNTQTRETGVIAQEIRDILPEVVGDKGEYLGVAYGNIVGVLIEAIKELKSRVVELENQIN